jgi:O-antigen/teichoic acid export membrane protein
VVRQRQGRELDGNWMITFSAILGETVKISNYMAVLSNLKNVLPRPAQVRWQPILKNKFITNAATYISGNVVQKGLVFLLIPIWARFLTPEDYGITGTLTVYGGVLFTLLVMGIHSSVTRHFHSYSDDVVEQKSYVTSITLFLILVPGAIVIALNIWGAGLWARYTTGAIPFDPYVRLMLWSVYALALTQIPLSLYQTQEKARPFVFIQYGKFFLEVLAMILLVAVLQLRAYGMILSQLSVNLVIVAVVMVLLGRRWFTWRVKWRYVRVALIFGLPLVPHLIFSQVLLAADRVILEYFVPLTVIGSYNVGYMMGMAMLVLVASINQAWMPYYYRLMKTDRQPEVKIVKVVSLYVAFIGGLCLLGVLFIGEIVHIVMPSTYYGAVRYATPIMVGYLLLGYYYFAAMPLFYFEKTALVPLLTGAAVVLNIGLNLWLIPLYGAIAAAWTTAATQGVLLFLVFILGQRYQVIHYPLAKYGIATLIILLSAVVGQQLVIFDPWSWLIKIALLLIFGITVFFTLIRPYANLTER